MTSIEASLRRIYPNATDEEIDKGVAACTNRRGKALRDFHDLTGPGQFAQIEREMFGFGDHSSKRSATVGTYPSL